MNVIHLRLTFLIIGYWAALITLQATESQSAPPPAVVAAHGNVQNYKPDLATGRAPSFEEVAAAEKEAAEHPQDFFIARKLGKTYFYRFFGAHEATAAPKAHIALTHALSLKPDDAETLSFLGSVERLTGHEREGREIMAKARKLDPANIGVLGLLCGFGDVSAMEQLRAMPEFASMSAHGRQRVFLGLGKDRARHGRTEEARALFTEGLAVSKNTREARMLADEMSLLK